MNDFLKSVQVQNARMYPWNQAYSLDMPLVPTGGDLGYRGLRGLGRSSRRMRGMGTITDLGVWDKVKAYVLSQISDSDYENVKSIMSGEYAERLDSLYYEMQRRKADLESYRSKMETDEQQYAYETALSVYQEFEAQVLQAITWYQNGIWRMRSVKAYADALGFGIEVPDYYTPSGLGRMGELSTAAIIAIASAVVAVCLSTAYSSYLKSSMQSEIVARASNEDIKGLIRNLPGSFWEGGGSTPILSDVSSIAKYAAIGAVAFFGFKLIMDSGGLKGLSQSFGGKS